MRKLAIIINGRGGVGKDTMCDVAATRFCVRNKSSVDPIKDIAKMAGWNPAVKDDRARKFLSDLKRLTVEYNDFPTTWCLAQYRAFLENPDEEIFFCHIREPEEIDKFKKATDGAAKTLLIRSNSRLHVGAYGNASDDRVEDFAYDYIFDNDLPLSESSEKFLALLEKMFTDQTDQ